MVEPRKAAAGIILNNAAEPEVLMVRRSDKLRFMGGHHAFPGGAIGRDEGLARVNGAPSEEEGRAIHAVVREIFEETGLLIAEGPELGAEALRAARVEILEDESRFDPFLEQHGFEIDARRFEPAGIWITPEAAPIRFHTRYYLIRHDGPKSEELIEGELSALEWLSPRQTRKRWRLGKLLLPAPVAYSLQLMAGYSYPEFLQRLEEAPRRLGGDPGRLEWRCGISFIPLETKTLPPATHTNCVLIGERELYVIDPGTDDPGERRRLKVELDQLVDMGAKIAAVLLTHGHGDHTGSATFVRDEYGAPIWAHPAVSERVDFEIDRTLEDNEIIPVAGDPEWRIRCLHTPGHDRGHLCYLEETSGSLVAGDMVAQQGTIVISQQFGGNMTDYMDSLRRMLEWDFDLAIPSHGFVLVKGKDKIRETLEHRQMREDKIKDALDGGADTMQTLLAAAYDDVDPKIWPLAEHSLRAHLDRLGVEM